MLPIKAEKKKNDVQKKKSRRGDVFSLRHDISPLRD